MDLGRPGILQGPIENPDFFIFEEFIEETLPEAQWTEEISVFAKSTANMNPTPGEERTLIRRYPENCQNHRAAATKITGGVISPQITRKGELLVKPTLCIVDACVRTVLLVFVFCPEKKFLWRCIFVVQHKRQN